MPPRVIPFGRPMFGDAERQAVLDVLAGPTLTHGPRVRAFEARFAEITGAPHAIAVGSCTAGMELVWRSIGLGPGDEVIVSAQTHVATAHAVIMTGATPVFADSEPVTGNVDPTLLESLVTPRTRAIAVVHYLGLPADLDAIRSVAGRNGLFLLEDCALSLGGRYRDAHTGLIGDAGCFSFYPVKHITTGEGGMVITRHADLARRIESMRAFGLDRSDPAARRHPGAYDVVGPGANHRMGELAGALGLCQLDRLADFLARRSANDAVLVGRLRRIAEETGALRVLGDGGDSAGSHPRHTDTVDAPGRVNRAAPPAEADPRRPARICRSIVLADRLVPQRDSIIMALSDAGIGTSVYYPRPVPCFTWYRRTFGDGPATRVPVAAAISRGSIALPIGPHLDSTDMTAIADALGSILCGTRA